MSKKILFIFIFLFSSGIFYGQDKKTREINLDSTYVFGLGFKNKDSFSLLFKIKNRTHSLRFEAFTLNSVWEKNRHNTEFSGLDTVRVQNSWDRHFDLGLKIGMEKNFPILPNVKFIHGPFVSGYFYYEYSRQPYLFHADEEWDFESGIGYLVGINYAINNLFSVSAELLPQLSYHWERLFEHDLYPDRDLGKDGKAKLSDMKFRIRNTIQISIFLKL